MQKTFLTFSFLTEIELFDSYIWPSSEDKLGVSLVFRAGLVIYTWIFFLKLLPLTEVGNVGSEGRIFNKGRNRYPEGRAHLQTS